MLVHDRTQAGVDAHQVGSIESSSLRPEPANAPPNSPHASLTAHAPRISHAAVACRGYRVHGKAYVTSSTVRDQASFLAIRDHSVYPITRTTARCIADGRLSICRRKTCLLSRSSPASRELQLLPRTPSSRISSPTWLHHRRRSAKTTSVQSLRHVSKTVLYTLRPAGSPCVRPRSHARTMAPSLTVRLKRCHVLTVMQHAVLRTITILVRLSCRLCVSLRIFALYYLSESCILAFVSTSQICCGDVFAAESEREVSPHMLLCHGC